jgi:hypothetical protein
MSLLKNMLYSALVAAILLVGVGINYSSAASFEIYLIKTDDADLQKAELYDTPLLTADDIISYNWGKHYITLTDNSEKKIVDNTKLFLKHFMVIADNIRCYKGVFWTYRSAQIPPELIINIGPYNDKRDRNVISIVFSQRFKKVGAGPDPRNNELIHRTLLELGKIEKQEK